MQKGFLEETPEIEGFLEQLKRAETVAEFRKALQQQAESFLEVVEQTRDSNNNNSIYQAKQYVKQHLSEKLTVRSVAKKIFLSPNYFATLFKQREGINFTDYVARARIEKAKELLAQEDVKVFYVAEEVGFNNSRYFSQFFKRYTNYTPSEYREHLKEGGTI